jgi:putative transposase
MAIYSFIAEEQADPHSEWSVSEMCKTLEVSRSGFYDWQRRPPSTRELTDRQLEIEIEAIWECSDRTYGAPRVHRWLRQQGFRVGRKRVARIMRLNGWEGETGRRKVRTTIVDRGATAATDRVGRDFKPTAPDVAWCGDAQCRRRHWMSYADLWTMPMFLGPCFDGGAFAAVWSA